VIIAFIGVAAYLVIIATKPRGLLAHASLRGLVDAGVAGHAWAFLYRLPNMAVLIGCQVLFIHCFGIDLPLGAALLYLPAVMFVMGMPISIQGLGPTQLAQVALFARFVHGSRASAEAAVLAWGLGSMLLMTTGAFRVGLACLTTETGRSGLRAARSGTAVPASRSETLVSTSKA
jgi:hypothetical protein